MLVGQHGCRLDPGFSVLVDLVLLPEINLIDGFLNLALECRLEVRNLVVLGQGVSSDRVSVHVR